MFEDDKCYYYIIDNKYVGSVYEKIWNNNGVIIKLENDDNYQDDVFSIKSNRNDFQMGGSFKDSKNTKGLMLLTRDYPKEKIKKVNNNSLVIESFCLMDCKKSSINMDSIIKSVNEKINSIPIIIEEEFSDSEDIIPPEIDNALLDRIFNEDQVVYNKEMKRKKLELSEAEELKLKKVIIDKVTKQISFDTEYYYDFDKSLMYKYLSDSEIDITSFGKKIINIIMNKLMYFEMNLKNEDGELIDEEKTLFEEYTLFDFLEFNIKGEYIEIINKNCNKRVIKEEDVPDLQIFTNQYGNEINYVNLCAMLSSLTSESGDSGIINEILKITCQEYIVALQPKVNLLIWCVVRILICIYANENFNKNIYSVKILINLFKSRSSELKNKNNVKPLITIHPQYGNNNAFYTITRLNKYFFRFREFGDKNNIPTYFKSSDGNYLIYYTNGSTDMKQYFSLLKNKSLKERIYDNEMISINNKDGSIEYDIKNLESVSKKEKNKSKSI